MAQYDKQSAIPQAVKLVGLVSSYHEGRLLQGCLRSLEAAEPDRILVYEGPAGDPLPPEALAAAPVSAWGDTRCHTGRWRTDARKRNEMVQEAKRIVWADGNEDGEVWGVWLDGDEVLHGGEWLRDILQSVSWRDAEERRLNPEALPTVRYPLRKIEPDGTMSTTGSRLVRLDLIRSIDVSVSVVTTAAGIEEAWGDRLDDSQLWIRLFLQAIDAGRMIGWPPLPCEPVIVHRSHLRHPARSGLRMHHQEKEELERAGLYDATGRQIERPPTG